MIIRKRQNIQGARSISGYALPAYLTRISEYGAGLVRLNAALEAKR